MLERTRHYNTAGKDDLTPRQREVLKLVAAGKTNPEIAEQLGITLDGAKFHVREILAKLEVDSREEAAAWWRAERRPARRLLRGVGWFVPRVAVLVGVVVFVAATGIVVVFAIATATGGGKPAAAYVPACAEKDLTIEMDSALNDPNLAQSEDPSVRLNVRVATGRKCHLNSELTVGEEPFDLNTSSVWPASMRFDLILDGGVGTAFDLRGWCDRYSGAEITARIGGAIATSVLDFPAGPCEDLLPKRCFDLDGKAVDPCPIGPAVLMQPNSLSIKADILPACNVANLRMGLSTSVAPPPGAGTIPGVPPPNEWSGFEVTWTTAKRPVDCEFASAITVRLLDTNGTEVSMPPIEFDQPRAIVARFRRVKLPLVAASNGLEVHLPRTGGNGDYATETSLVSSTEGTRFFWRNWCGEDRSPVTVEVTSAVDRLTTVIEPPPCADPAGRTSFGTFDN